MEEDKNTKVFEDMWTAIKDLEKMVNRIYYIGQCDIADEFDEKVHDLKKRFYECNQLSSLENQINQFAQNGQNLSTNLETNLQKIEHIIKNNKK